MKFILNKDKLEIDNLDYPNSGSVKYYEAEVEFDESWEGLTIKAVIMKEGDDTGTSVALINNKVFIDRELNGKHFIGFVGYTIENDIKTYQISSNLQIVHFAQGAGEIETSEEDVPTPSQWEIYIAQIQEMLDNYSGVPSGGTTGQVLAKKSNADGDVEWIDVQGGSSDTVYKGPNPPSNNALIWIDTSGDSPSVSSQLLTANNECFMTVNNENFILKEEN